MEFDDCYSLLQCKSIKSLSYTFEKLIADIGIKTYGHFMVNKRINMPLEVIGNYPESWVDEYVNCNYIELDNCISLAQHSTEAFAFNEARILTNEKRHADFWQAAKNSGMYYGVAVPISNDINNFIASGFTIDEYKENEWLAKYKKYLTISTQIFHQCYIRLLKPPYLTVSQYKITTREKECAQWLCSGYTLDNIAKKLNISERTVRFHLHQLKIKLGATNKAQIIAKLVMYNLVEL